MQFIIIIILSFLLTKFSLKLISKLLVETNLVAENYKGEKIPLGYGLIFSLDLILILIFGSLISYYSIKEVYYLIILVLTMAFLGLLDDTLGDKENQGFNGHFKALLFKGKLTTGAIKAVFSLFLIFFINFYWTDSLIQIVINSIVTLLMTNFINLLDLRPGRALKMTLVFLVFLLLFNLNSYSLFVPIMIVVIIALKFDLAAKGMMGDVGANVLGVILGGLMVLFFSLGYKLIFILVLVVIHIYAEMYSISDLIKDNKILSYLDQLGR